VGLTEDQKAMLRLLAQRGEEGYEDIAALKGIGVEEARERVKEALAEVSGPEEPPVPKPPEPPPASPTPAPRQPPAPSADEAPVAEPVAKAPPAAPGTRVHSARLGLPRDRGALIGVGAGALAILALAIVLIVSGGESDSGSSPTAGEAALAENAGSEAGEQNLTQAVLEPVPGGEGRGRALFGRYRKSVLLQVEAEGLKPSPAGQSYTIWLYRTPKLALQIGAVPVGASGKIAAQFKIPAQLLAYVASGAFNQVDVSLTSTAAYRAELARAKADRKLPPHLGTSVLRGEITGPAIRKK
jgi:hypothetical protein